MLTRRLPLRRRLLPHPILLTHRSISTTPATQTTFKKPSPSPPRLPAEDQKIFDELTKSPGNDSQFSSNLSVPAKEMTAEELDKLIAAEEKHQDLRRGEKPLFEGETNPVTGEVGGPKTDPLKYGDWSFNGRVTDF